MKVLKITKKEISVNNLTFPVYTGILGEVEKDKNGYYDFNGAYLIRDVKFMIDVSATLSKLAFPITIKDPIEIKIKNGEGDYFYLPKLDKNKQKIKNKDGKYIYRFVIRDIPLEKLETADSKDFKYKPYENLTAEKALSDIEKSQIEKKQQETVEKLRKDVDNLPF